MLKRTKIGIIFITLNMFFFVYAYSSNTNLEIRGLFTGTDTNKIEIIKKLIVSKNKVYLPELGEVLSSDKNEEVRSNASLALLENGDSTCIPYYKKAIEDSYWLVRLYGIQGLVKFGDITLIPDFRKAMRDSYWQVRYYAATGLGKYGDEKNISFLATSLRDSNEEVKGEILWALFNFMWKDASRVEFKKLNDNQIKNINDAVSSSNPEIRIKVLWLLEASRDKKMVPLLIKMLEDENDEIKIRALWAIEKLKSEEGNNEIEGLLEGESTKVKIESIKTLVRLKSSESVTGLVNGLSDTDENVRIYSLWALEKFREPLTYPYIVAKLDDNSSRIREYARNIIKNINDPILYSIIQTFIDDENISLDSKLSAMLLLGSIGGENVKGFLLEKTKSSDHLLRYTAINSLFMASTFDDEFLKILVYQENYDANTRVKNQSQLLIRKIVKELDIKLKSSDIKERQFALSKIEPLYGSKSLPNLLLKMAYSKYPEVRESMLVTAKNMPSKVYGKSFISLIKESDMSIKKLTAFAIGEAEYREAIPLLKEGLRHFDPEFQLICAWALAKMRVSDAFSFGVKYLQSSNVEYQKLSAEIFVYLVDRRASGLLLRSILDSELEVKLISSRALARMGEEKGLEILVRLSEESIEPIRTLANVYLEDKNIPQNLRKKTPQIREKLQVEKLGIFEINPKMVNALPVKHPISIDGSDKDRFWGSAKKESLFILINEEKVPSAIQTKVAVGYDKKNLYMLFICDDPNSKNLNLNSRDFITISINPLNSEKEWYQFVIHPIGEIKYSYVWKLYEKEESEKPWTGEWQASTTIEESRWVLEVSIPFSNFQVENVFPNDKWSINFQRDSQQVPLTTWTGRIDTPEQFGIINFKE